MSYETYPTADDLQAKILSMGLTVPPTLNLQAKCDDASSTFENRVQWFPYLSDGVPRVRRFDPPGPTASSGRTASYRGGKHLELHSGLLDVTSGSNGVAIGVINLANGANAEPVNAGTLLQFNVQYFCRPDNAIERGLSWTEIEFISPIAGVPKSIQITGVWGRVRKLPADVWGAVLGYALYLCRPELAVNISKGLSAAQDEKSSVRFTDPLSTEFQQLKDTFDEVCKRKRRL